jgi:hypothetical protein
VSRSRKHWSIHPNPRTSLWRIALLAKYRDKFTIYWLQDAVAVTESWDDKSLGSIPVNEKVWFAKKVRCRVGYHSGNNFHFGILAGNTFCYILQSFETLDKEMPRNSWQQLSSVIQVWSLLNLVLRSRDGVCKNLWETILKLLLHWTKLKTPWPESASELYRPSYHRLSAKIVSTFAGRGVSGGQRDWSLWTYYRLSRHIYIYIHTHTHTHTHTHQYYIYFYDLPVPKPTSAFQTLLYI